MLKIANIRFYPHFPKNRKYTKFSDSINDSRTRSYILFCEYHEERSLNMHDQHGSVASFIDITELKEAEKILKKASGELEQLVEERKKQLEKS
jgi:hypothetical protein